MKLIGIGVKAQQGKTTFAYALQNELIKQQVTRNQRVIVYNFSDPLVAHARVAGLMGDKNNGILQVLGTNVYRELDPAFWININGQKISDDEPTIAIITGIRFLNEVDWIKKQGGVLVKITRVESVGGTSFVDPSRPTTHVSETELDSFNDWDWRIENIQDNWQEFFKDAHVLAANLIFRWTNTPT